MTCPIDRRSLLASAVWGALGLALTAAPALAVTQAAARQLVDGLVAEINAVITSGQSEAAMLDRFEAIFDRYADVPTIAAYVLGPERARVTNAGKLGAFTDAYKTYVARKYGRRFREFIGGQVVVQGTAALPRGVAVQTVAELPGQAPFRVDFHVEDSRGRPLFFNLIVEGVNMLLSERQEVLSILDRQGGDIDRLIAYLRAA